MKTDFKRSIRTLKLSSRASLRPEWRSVALRSSSLELQDIFCLIILTDCSPKLAIAGIRSTGFRYECPAAVQQMISSSKSCTKNIPMSAFLTDK